MPFPIRRLAIASVSLAALAAPQIASAASGSAARADVLSHTGRQVAVATTARHHHARRHRAHISSVACTSTGVSLNGKHLDVSRRATLCLLNKIRGQHGLSQLTASTSLRDAAFGHSRDMVQHRYFSHGDFVGRIKASGYLSGAHSYAVAENIGWGAASLQTPAKMVNAWMASPGHKANILNGTYHQIGVGIALGTPTGAAGGTYTTDFGKRS